MGKIKLAHLLFHQYLKRRGISKHQKEALYFKPDENAEYAETHDIDLSKVSPLVALYPDPDNAQTAKKLEDEGTILTQLDGCFIGDGYIQYDCIGLTST